MDVKEIGKQLPLRLEAMRSRYIGRPALSRMNVGNHNNNWDECHILAIEIREFGDLVYSVTLNNGTLRNCSTANDISIYFEECREPGCGTLLPCRELYKHYESLHPLAIGGQPQFRDFQDFLLRNYRLRFAQCLLHNCNRVFLNTLMGNHLDEHRFYDGL